MLPSLWSKINICTIYFISLEDIMGRSQCLTIFKQFLDTEGWSYLPLFVNVVLRVSFFYYPVVVYFPVMVMSFSAVACHHTFVFWFVKCMYCCAGTSQTLLFLIEVDEFQKIPEIGFQQNRAKKLFFKFIHSKGKQVDVCLIKKQICIFCRNIHYLFFAHENWYLLYFGVAWADVALYLMLLW